MLVPASYLRLGCSMQELTDVYVSKAQFVPAGFFCGKTDFGRLTKKIKNKQKKMDSVYFVLISAESGFGSCN